MTKPRPVLLGQIALALVIVNLTLTGFTGYTVAHAHPAGHQDTMPALQMP